MYKNKTSPQIAQIMKENGNDWYTLITPYNDEFLNYFRGVVSSSRRKWNPDKKLWTFAPEYLIQVYYYAKDIFQDVIGDAYVKEELRLRLETKTNPYAVMYLTKQAPDWLVEKVFRLLMGDERSEFRHPDKGGEQAKAAELNTAMDKIRKREIK